MHKDARDRAPLRHAGYWLPIRLPCGGSSGSLNPHSLVLDCNAVSAHPALASRVQATPTSLPAAYRDSRAWTTAAATISGLARVIDGDTVVVAGTRVRLKGVDAAELGTARGENARRVMAMLVTGSLTCRLTGEKTYSREVGYCTTANGTDINRAIIAQGAALACPRYDDRYVQFEQAEALAAQPRASYCVRR